MPLSGSLMPMRGRARQPPAITPEDVARIVERPDEKAFVDLLRESDAEFEDATFELALAEALRVEPSLIDLWDLWSGDQRWSPSAYVEGVETGWFDRRKRRHARVHPDRAAAVADFIHRLAARLVRREVIEVDQ
jgi:hypothetical protein